MIYVQRCECEHPDHTDGGPGHPFSAVVSEQEIMPAGWVKGHTAMICRPCWNVGHRIKGAVNA